MRVGVVFAVVSPFAGWRGFGGFLGLLEAHGAQRQLDDRGLVDGGDAVGRDALGEQEPAELVVGLGRAVRAEVLRQFRSASLACSACRAAKSSCSACSWAIAMSAWPRRPASASSASSSWRCWLSRCTSAGFSSASASSRPATTGRRKPAGRPDRSAATSQPPARRRRRRPGRASASSRAWVASRVFSLTEGDALLLVLGEHRPQPVTARPATPPCRRRSRIPAASGNVRPGSELAWDRRPWRQFLRIALPRAEASTGAAGSSACRPSRPPPPDVDRFRRDQPQSLRPYLPERSGRLPPNDFATS